MNTVHNENYFNIRFQVKPLMLWIWISVLLISFGGILSFLNKKIMKNKISLFLIIISLIFVFIIFYKGLSKTTLYEPSRIQNIPEFTSVTF